MDDEEISKVFRHEYSNLLAVLCHYYKVQDLQLAEDVVSETFLSAMKTWAHKGMPNDPKPWLRKVAQNKLLDHYRRKKVFIDKVSPHIKDTTDHFDLEPITDDIIEDSQLRMIFVVCNPKVNQEAQLSLALRILCGFSIEEIAKALLSNKETINKKLFRAKKKFKESKPFQISLTKAEHVDRLDSVLRVIYLLFNEGYYSSINEANIRDEICWEAMRLTIFLAEQSIFPKPKIHALLALMCFHASRLDARKSGDDGDVLYFNQDRRKWNAGLIRKGQRYLTLSATGSNVSKYHLEAAIAFWHTLDDEKKWSNIVSLYDRLLMIEHSPVILMNRTYAIARAVSVDDAIVTAHKLKLNNNHLYFCLLAELYKMKGSFAKEIEHLKIALDLANKQNEKDLIKGRLDRVIQEVEKGKSDEREN